MDPRRGICTREENFGEGEESVECVLGDVGECVKGHGEPSGGDDGAE